MNFKSNMRVSFQVGTSFLWFSKFDFNVIFLQFLESSEKNKFQIITFECSETPVSELFPNFLTQKQGFLTQKLEIISELISKLFLQNFVKFENTGYFQKISELWKPNYSETRENKKFRKFCLMQGLNKLSLANFKYSP